MFMNVVELLAPAKNYDTAIAAINSGADAVYIGASDFGARVNASNTLESIEKLVNYAHKFYVKVHVTINTILNDFELEQAIELIKNLYNIGVDAIIVQDMGLIQAAIDGKIPPIPIHASTQCDNRTLEKVMFFDKLGVSRVILARELSLDQIKDICDNVSCEIETFIHGALCVSYSGQCYMSYANGGRSANRGECAQPCRKKYSLIDKNGKIYLKDKYLLSLKDFNASESIVELINCGVKSFKIEGRLKDINYVRNVVLYYNNLISTFAKKSSSGKVFTDFRPDLKKTFNRGYTDYFLNSRNKCYNFDSPKFIGEKIGSIVEVGKNYFVIDSDILKSQDGLTFFVNGKLQGCLVNRVEGRKIFPNKMDNISIGLVIYRNTDFEFEKKLQNADIIRKIAVSFSISDDEIIALDEDNNNVSVKLPIGETPNNPERIKEIYKKQLLKSGESDFYVKDINFKSANLPFLPVSKINELRRQLLSLLISKRIENYKRELQKPIHYTKFPMSKIDYRGNVFNNAAKKFYKNCDCKCDDALEKSSKIPSGIELMRTKHCLKYASGLCRKHIDPLYLVDENLKKYPLIFDCKNCEMVVLSP